MTQKLIAPWAWSDSEGANRAWAEMEQAGLLEITMRNHGGLKAMMWSWLRHVDLRRGIIVNHTEEIQRFLHSVCQSTECTTIDQRLRELQMHRVTEGAPA